jgi:chromosome segregation ATPase
MNDPSTVIREALKHSNLRDEALAALAEIEEALANISLERDQANSYIEELQAELAELRQEMKRRLAASAERVQMDGAELARLREALERIKNRAQRVVDGRLECTSFSVADYDLQVTTSALAVSPEEGPQKHESAPSVEDEARVVQD